MLQHVENDIRIWVTSCPGRYGGGIGDGWLLVGLPEDEQRRKRFVAYDLRAAGLMDEDGHLLPNPDREF